MIRARLTFSILALTAPLLLVAADTGKPATPPIDPNRIINESYGFLKNREPEMTATEFALYDRVVGLIATRPEYAMKLLEGILGEKTPASPAFEFVLGNAYYSSGKHETAIAHYRVAVEKSPDFIRAWTNLGVTYYANGRYLDAIPCFTKAIALGEHTASNYGLLAYCQAKAGNALAAEMAYTEAFALDPGNADWVRGLVELLVATKQYPRAEALVRELVRLRPEDATNWTLHASILLAQEQKIEAIAVLETAGDAGHLEDSALLLLGDLYAERKFAREAVATYRRALATNPAAGAERLLRYAQSLIALEKFAEARALLAPLADQPGRENKVLYLETVATLCFATHATSEARKHLEEVMAIDPLNGRALLGLGELYAGAGETAKSRLVYEAAARQTQFAYTANVGLAQLALDAKDYAGCATHLRTALELQPSPQLREYLAQVSALIPNHEK